MSEPRWTKDGLWFLRNEGGATSLGFLASPEGKWETVLPARGMIHTLNSDATGRRLALMREDVTRPADVWLMDTAPEKGTRADSLQQVTFSSARRRQAGRAEPRRNDDLRELR